MEIETVRPRAELQPAEPPRPCPAWLVVTDLDGTLLDDDYDLRAAGAAVDRQVALGRLVVLASSKTLDEMLALARLCARPPILIFENGAGIAWPASSAGRAVTAGGPAVAYRSDLTGDGYAELRSRLRSLRRRGGYRFLGFGDLSAREVARHTGLSLDGARLARHRAASEPLLWLDTVERLEAFRTEVNSPPTGWWKAAGFSTSCLLPTRPRLWAASRRD
jgi:mannosyl-3-phosphoglycerate phosphatase